MSLDIAFQGSLFASDFLRDAITRSPDWQELDDASLLIMRRRDPGVLHLEDAANDLGEMVRSIEFSPL